MFSSVNKTFFVAATKNLPAAPNFVAVTKQFFPASWYSEKGKNNHCSCITDFF